jgi:osmoprotectant transport system substrate-binding protein
MTMSTSIFTRARALVAALIVSSWALTASAASIVVGGKNFTEQQLMAEMTSELLEAKGFSVVKKDGMGSSVLRQAQENGQVDVYWEYTGTSLITFNKINDRLSTDETYKKVKDLDAAKGLVWLDPSRANNTYAFAMNQDEAKKLGISTLSDLAKAVKAGKTLTFACNSEFYARPDGLRPLQKTYGFEFSQDEVKRMDSGLTYQALKDRQVNIALVFATDGRVPAFNFVILKDDKGYFPSYALTPVIRKATLDANPKLGPILNALSAKLDVPTMARLNASVDVQKKSFSDVAHGFLKESGLL